MQVRITSIRRAVQVFFLALAVWFSVAPAIRETSGTHGGWPIRWMLELDPLVALTTSLASGSLVTGLAWSLLLVVTTLFIGRYFCGWVCPLGTLQQFIGWVSWRAMPLAARIKVNTYSEKQKAKWGILLLHLAAASGGTLVAVVSASASLWWLPVGVFGVAAGILWRMTAQGRFKKPADAWLWFGGVVLLYAWLAWSPRAHLLLSSSIQGEVLDPIPLFYRLLDLLLLPLADAAAGVMSPAPRTYAYGGLTALLGLAVLGSSVLVPRAFCRFACPLGAMLGTMSSKAVYRIASDAPSCIDCGLCDAVCEGACNPSGQIRSSECLLCMNCVEVCPDNLLALRTVPNAPGEIVGSGLSRRGAMMSAAAGFAFVPALRLGGKTRTGWTEGLIRPPGALPEEEFLSRCISCERCVHVCPTNVIQPAGLKAGFEAMWTPALDMRVGTSGCLPNCTACGQACPTGALKPLTLDEKSGKGDFAAQGPLSLGTAFVDHGRCLPWSMDKFCIVCQEVCPTSPKAITTRPRYATLRDGRVDVDGLDGDRVSIAGPLPEGVVQGIYLRPADQDDASAKRVIRIEGGDVVLEGALLPEDLKRSGGQVELQARLEVPYVDPELCIGCGICEHECPIDGERAIRVTAEGESREPSHSIVL